MSRFWRPWHRHSGAPLENKHVAVCSDKTTFFQKHEKLFLPNLLLWSFSFTKKMFFQLLKKSSFVRARQRRQCLRPSCLKIVFFLGTALHLIGAVPRVHCNTYILRHRFEIENFFSLIIIGSLNGLHFHKWQVMNNNGFKNQQNPWINKKVSH